MPTIDLIITVYNKKPFLERCFESVAMLTTKPSRIIIIDDGSTDGGSNVCDEYSNRYGWEIYHQENKGVAAARNKGIELATADYITFLDADDMLVPKAISTMQEAAEQGHNIVQFKQYRWRSYGLRNEVPYGAKAGHYGFSGIPKYWVMVWNKIYKRDFINESKLRFKDGMQFGEDTIFNAECILANGGFYHAEKPTVIHIWDDNSSLCRGMLTLNRILRLDREMVSLYESSKDEMEKQWLRRAIDEHRGSKLYRKYGYSDDLKADYDVVYFVKDTAENEELRYSLRSLENNWPYNRVWFAGGCPGRLNPDKHMNLEQTGDDKWNKVRSMIRTVCENDDITEDFWLFNDDFFVLKQSAMQLLPTYNKDLGTYAEQTDEKVGPSEFTKRLRKAEEKLQESGKYTLNYEVHKPMLINRKKAIEVLDEFPDTPGFRSLYGNYWQIGGTNKPDKKIKVLDYNKMDAVKTKWSFVSTSDDSFNYGNIGKFLREKFNKPSRFEKERQNER